VTTEMSRAGLLCRGALGGGALLVSASGLAAVAPAAWADTPSANDLAYLRLLIAAELLAVDFTTHALESGKLRASAARALFRRIHADENAHYTRLAALLTAAGQSPATAADIDFSYPKGSLRSQRSILALGGRLEHLMVGAYVGAVVNVESSDLRLPIGQIAANEAQHQGALAALRGDEAVGPSFAPGLQIGAVSDALDAFES
jgi:rubrerythrin